MTEIPGYADLMYPTLQAIAALGNQANKDKINANVRELAGITDEQMAVEYPETATQAGKSKVVHRLAFARSYLKKLGAIDNAERGIWTLLDQGRHYLDIGEDQLRHDEHELRVGKRPDLFLKKTARTVHEGEPTQLTVRKLLAEWDVKRRGADVVQRIRRDLSESELTTEPPFDTIGIDDEVQILKLGSAPVLPDDSATRVSVDAESISRTVTIGTLDSARSSLIGIDPSDDITKAQSLMESHDYSQLAVVSGQRDIKGSISWESIARASLHRSTVRIVADAMDPNPTIVRDSEPLLDLIDAIAQSGFVFVIDSKRLPVGIVTTADLSLQFAATANPFLIVGEIERWLRSAVDFCFDADELAEFADPDDPDRQITAAQNLTFGEYVRLLQNADAWARLEWNADRKVFIDHLDEVRIIRNDIMHFGPDPIGQDEIERLKTMLRWLKRLVETSRSRAPTT